MKDKLRKLIVSKGYLPRKAFWKFAIPIYLLILIGRIILLLAMACGFMALFAMGGPYFIPLILGFLMGLIISTVWIVYLTIALITHIIRRLRDTDCNVYLSILYFIPVIGWIILIILLLMPSRRADQNNL